MKHAQSYGLSMALNQKFLSKTLLLEMLLYSKQVMLFQLIAFLLKNKIFKLMSLYTTKRIKMTINLLQSNVQLAWISKSMTTQIHVCFMERQL